MARNKHSSRFTCSVSTMQTCNPMSSIEDIVACVCLAGYLGGRDSATHTGIKNIPQANFQKPVRLATSECIACIRRFTNCQTSPGYLSLPPSTSSIGMRHHAVTSPEVVTERRPALLAGRRFFPKLVNEPGANNSEKNQRAQSRHHCTCTKIDPGIICLALGPYRNRAYPYFHRPILALSNYSWRS